MIRNRSTSLVASNESALYARLKKQLKCSLEPDEHCLFSSKLAYYNNRSMPEYLSEFSLWPNGLKFIEKANTRTQNILL